MKFLRKISTPLVGPQYTMGEMEESLLYEGADGKPVAMQKGLASVFPTENAIAAVLLASDSKDRFYLLDVWENTTTPAQAEYGLIPALKQWKADMILETTLVAPVAEIPPAQQSQRNVFYCAIDKEDIFEPIMASHRVTIAEGEFAHYELKRSHQLYVACEEKWPRLSEGMRLIRTRENPAVFAYFQGIGDLFLRAGDYYGYSYAEW